MTGTQNGPLAGIRVLELAHIMAGPVCGLMLADLGADVVKVERPNGDDTRRFLPPDINGEAAAFMMMNRNKRGIALDLKTEGGRSVLLKLVEKADVLIENYRRDTMEKLGLAYESLRQVNPGLIYCEISGFGRTGPYADQGGFDLIAQGMSGLMSITGEAPGRPPVKVGAPVTDITAGILGALGVLSAYIHRLKTGEGQRVDTSLFEAGITHTYWQSAICFASGQVPGPMGSAHPLNAPYQAFETSDGWVNIGGANQINWERMLDVIEAAELQEDERFSSNEQRMAHLDALVEVLTPFFKKHDTDYWVKELEAKGIPVGPVLSIKDMQSHPQTLAREMVVELDHPVAGKVNAIGLPIKLSQSPGRVSRPAPRLGEHSSEVLREADYTEAEIAKLMKTGAVICKI